MDGQRASLFLPGSTLLASLVAGVTYAVYRAHQLVERWRPRGVSVLPALFVVATALSYVADGGTLSQPPPHGTPAGQPPPADHGAGPSAAPPVATRGVPDSALPRQGLDVGYDFGPPGSPHPVPGPTRAAASVVPLGSATPPRAPASPAPPPPPAPPRHRLVPPLPPLPRPPIPRPPIPGIPLPLKP